MALALNAARHRAMICETVRGDVSLHVFFLRMLLDPSFDSAVAELTVYPGLLLSKLHEVEWMVLTVGFFHAVLMANRWQLCRFTSK